MKKRIILLALAVLLTALLLLTSSFAAGDDASLSADQGSVTTNEDITIYTVTIEYVYGDNSKFKGQRVAVPYIAEVAAGDTLTGTVTSPNCVGYTPNFPSINLAELGAINGNVTKTVTYSPAEVSYTVRHYQQNIDNDEYTWVDTTMATGYTEALTSNAAAKTYTGFTALPHYHEEIAADSSTMIDIYYDRDYYLMSFDLQGGFGVEPIYARYGAPISVGTPYQPGWNFDGWSDTIPSTMPAKDTSYAAFWTAKEVPFTVAYWLEDANVDGKYNFWDSTTQMDYAGATVQGSTYQDYTYYLTTAQVNAMDTYEKRYSYYNDEKTDIDVTIKGDGSTVVNVYYNRNEYTLKFYYAASTGSGTDAKYYVVGGSTYRFGATATIGDNGNEVALLDHYMGSYTSERGQVEKLPTLNPTGNARNYTKASETSKVNGTEYNYHYISFKAKYGEDISNLWPCDVFNSVTRLNTDQDKNNSAWNGTEAFVSAWNGEHHVCYSQLHSGVWGTVDDNQTIKGNYNELDYQLLWDFEQFGDSDTVAYLCFWENGADIWWSIPKLFRYNIYVPVLPGQDSTNLITKTYNGTTYCLWATYDTCDDSSVDKQTPPAINGFKYIEGSRYGNLIDNPDSGKYQTATEVNFFYDRESNNLTFVNGSTTAKHDSVPYGTDISGMAPTDLEYHDPELKDMYVFGGWYTSPNTLDGSEYDLTNATMPANPLALYAKWNLITHAVSIYKTEDDAENSTNRIGTADVTHDEPVPEASRPSTSGLEHPTDPSATFIGWFYKDENEKEQAFDFATMTITRDMTIYAKWRRNVMKQVNIRYVIKNEDGTETEVADSETMMLRLGQTRTFEAKTGSSLFLEYRSGCFPTTASHSITPTDVDIGDDTPITYSFTYKKYGTVPYQVEFLVKEADGTTRPAFYKDQSGKAVFVEHGQWNASYTGYVEQHWQNDKAVVTELYVPDDLAGSAWTLPDEYFPNALKIQKVIVPSGENPERNIEANVIQFIYTYTDPVNPDNPSNPVYEARYLVQHFIQNPSEQTQYDLYSYSDEEGLSGEIATASPISIPGYTFSSAETNTRMQTGTKLADNVMSGTITADDNLELNFYYTVNSYPYQVMYLEKDTNRVLLEAKTEDSNGPLTGRYGSRVSYTLGTDAEKALLSDYDVDAATKSIYIQMEAGGTANVNTIVFYYTRKSADLIISKMVELDAEQAKEEGISQLPEAVLAQEFTFTVTCPTGFHKSVYDCTVTDGSGETKKDVVAGTTTMTFTLEHGQTIKIHDLAMGDYTVAETYVPGFRTSVNQTIQQEYPVNLETNNVDVTAPFLNSYPFYTGDLVIMKKVAKADTSDPNATEPYKVTVVLKPDAAAREVDRVITFVDKDGKPLTDANNNSSFTIPKITGTDDQTEFCITLPVPVGGEVKMKGVPVGSFTATEEVEGTVGYIFDYYTVKYNKAVHQNDEATGTNHVVNGVIHGGHPTTVTFNNTYKKGTLTINKTVKLEYANDTWTSDTFTFEINGTTELPDGPYPVTGATVTVADGKVTVKGKDGQDPTITVNEVGKPVSLTFKNLPAGYYTVTEKSNAKYTTTGPTESLLVNDTEKPVNADFVNTYIRAKGNLQVGKEVRIVTPGSTIDKNQPFEFTVTLKDMALTGSFDCEVKTNENTPNDPSDDKTVPQSQTSLDVSDGKLTFSLMHNQYILIKNLPVGDYLVAETAVEGYDSSFGDVIASPKNYSVDPATIKANETTVLNCQNAYPVYYANLIVEKNVVTPSTNTPADQAPTGDMFTFQVKISNYSDKINLNGGIGAKFYKSANDELLKEETLAVISDTLTFRLKHGEWVDLNLPACNYTIAETVLNADQTVSEHYTVSYKIGETEGAAGASNTLVSGETETIVFTNTYKQHLGRLTISKTLLTPTVTPNSADSKDFLFHVTGNDVDMDVIVPGDGSVTIYDLPLGDYTVTEDTDWNWRYVIKDAAQTATLTVAAPDASVSFENTYSENKWLNFFHNVLNEFPKSN